MSVTFDEQQPATSRDPMEERQGFIIRLAIKSGVVKNVAQARVLLLGIAIVAVALTGVVIFFA